MSQSPKTSKIVIDQFEFRANWRRAGLAIGFRKSTTASHIFIKTIPTIPALVVSFPFWKKSK